MRTVREILKESDPQEIADILLRLHLNTLFEQAEPEDTVADIRRLVGEWTKRIISNILNAAPQKGGSPFVFFAVPAAADGSWWFGFGAIEAAMCEQSEILQDEPNPESYSWMDQTDAAIADSLFAETLLTAENRSEALAHILWDLTWFGETDEERRRYYDGLENDAYEPDDEEDEEVEPISELEMQFEKDIRGLFQSFIDRESELEEDEDDDFDSKAEFERFRAEREARRDEKEEKLKRAIDQAEHARYAYCFQREVRLVKALLEEHTAQKSGAE